MAKNAKELTKAEEQVMQYLWNVEKGFVKDIVDQFPDPQPAYTTVTTIIRILVNKGFVAYNTYGKTNEYYPLVSKKEYIEKHLKKVINNYFNGSAEKFTSFFTQNSDLSLNELEDIKKMIDQQIKNRKNNE